MLVGVGGVGGAQGRPVDPDRLITIPVTSMEVTAAMDPGLVAPGLICSGRAFVPSVGEMVFLLDECKVTRPSPKEQLYWLFDCIVRYGAGRLVFEDAALQAYLWQAIPASAQQYEREKGVELPWWVTRPNKEAKRLIGAKVDKVEGNKWTRVGNALSPFFEQRLVAVHPGITGWLDEYIIHPKGKRIDRLDAFAMTIKAWREVGPLSDKLQKSLDEDIILSHERFEEAMSSGGGYNANVGI
jgi:hypothetical protein